MLPLMISAALAAPLETGVTGLSSAKAVHVVFDDAAGTTSGCVSTPKGWACGVVDVDRPVNIGLVVDESLLPVGALSCLLYTSPSPRDRSLSRMPSSA